VTPSGASAVLRQHGRPPSCSPDLAVRIIRMRQAGLSYARICTALNAEQIPTPKGGGPWQKSYVDRLLHTRWVEAIAEQLNGASGEHNKT
jgi:hypothetical protein